MLPAASTDPCRRTESAAPAAERAFVWISSAESLPRPLVPASGSSLLHPVSPAPATVRAHTAPISAALLSRRRGVTNTGGAAFLTWADTEPAGHPGAVGRTLAAYRSVPGPRTANGASPSGAATRAEPFGTG